MIESKNVFYIHNFNTIGGVETYLFELARKYNNYDITIVYKTGSLEQIRRLKKYVRVIKFQGQKIICEKAFFNYETDIIDNIEAKEYIQLIHAMFKTQGIRPKINKKITKYFCVSESAGKEWEELTGLKPILCRNPLQITDEEKKSILYLISATRLTPEKGRDRMIRLAEELDKAKINYIWLVFTNDTNAINNPNVVYMKPRLNIRPFIASIKGKGYGVQLSNCEGDCYFTRECEGLGVPLICTPVLSFKEQGLIEGKNCYYMPFDMINVNVERLLNIPTYEPYIVQDGWRKMLVNSKSTYTEEERDMRYKVKATEAFKQYNLNPTELNFIPEKGYEFEVSEERVDLLKGNNKYNAKFIEVIGPVVEKAAVVKKGSKKIQKK